MATQPVPVVEHEEPVDDADLYPFGHQPRSGTCYFQTEAGGFNGPRGPHRSERQVSSVRRVMQHIGVVSLAYFVMVSTWWAIQPGFPEGMSFGVIAIGIALALANLVSLFVFTSLDDGRPDSHSYMAELVELQGPPQPAPVRRASSR